MKNPTVTNLSIKVCLSNNAWWEWDGKWGIGQYAKDYIDVAKIAEAFEQIKYLEEEAIL